ncbi:MAG: DUF4272 domain-containing protein [Planctomycetes bacterium]|nr:DUF4272 domain-containing protein [Planctomycetota bacterium]
MSEEKSNPAASAAQLSTNSLCATFIVRRRELDLNMCSDECNLRPTPEDAARRLVILKHVVVSALVAPPREMLREISSRWSEDEHLKFERQAEERRDQFWQPLRDCGLWEHLSPHEQEYAESTMATMTERQQVDASWRMEAALVLMWALGLVPEMPPYDTSADHDLLKEFPKPDVTTFVRTARLRDLAEIDRARGTAELWHWRSRTRELIERGDAFPADDRVAAAGFRSYDDVVRFSAQKAAEKGTMPPCIDDDFPAKGKAYRDLTEMQWSEVRSIANERHHALNWLCGYAPDNRWDDTPTDT